MKKSLQILTGSALTMGFLIGCGSHPIAHHFPKNYTGKSRVPAAELPAGYQVKAQDFWTYSVWKDPKANDLQALCKIRKTTEGFEVGTTNDPMGSAMMKKIDGVLEKNLASRLTSETGQGFENGYSPYWSECESKPGKDNKKCSGNFALFTFSEYQGTPSFDGGSSVDFYQERTFAVLRGENTWYQSSNATEVMKISACLCGKFARHEEAGKFPSWDASCERLSKTPVPESGRQPASVQAVVPAAI